MLNQLARYAPVVRLLEEVPGTTVLEVGSGSRGLARFLSSRWQITASDIDFSDYGRAPATNHTRARQVTADVCDLPFQDGEFDAVVAVDLVEHLPSAQRKQALDELVRVARGRVIVAVPAGPAALDADRRLRDFYRRRGTPPPAWLEEHIKNGFPDPAELAAALSPHGRLQLLPNESVKAHELIAKVEALRGGGPFSELLSKAVQPGVRGRHRLARRAFPRVLHLLRGLDRAPSYRTIAVLDRDDG
jgi:SAM-dependent methyltransferase